MQSNTSPYLHGVNELHHLFHFLPRLLHHGHHLVHLLGKTLLHCLQLCLYLRIRALPLPLQALLFLAYFLLTLAGQLGSILLVTARALVKLHFDFVQVSC